MLTHIAQLVSIFKPSLIDLLIPDITVAFTTPPEMIQVFLLVMERHEGKTEIRHPIGSWKCRALRRISNICNLVG
jgi:acetolactate synthase small subunit